ncbi:tetranectin-like [Brienomyrus brachyistius]|uniref:tetranectin-like n=1 Tax=Brienomyrus brachyistius TaxID=42636 RepID=UPI0020B2AA67|nr:tetranectin-like [Brienomyrus brachyistius]XP_048848657.1 tetranectin-like [Brienomyrus brachyistius]
MDFRPACLFLCVLILIHGSLQQSPPKKKPLKKDAVSFSTIEDLQKQIDEIVRDLTLLKEHQALQTVCLKGFKIHGKCFLVDPLKKRYHTANEDCIDKGGTLSTPLTRQENEQLYDYVRSTLGPDAQVWLGVNDMTTEGMWIDQTGSAVRYKNWESGLNFQPDGNRAQNCAVLSAAATGKWFDENCRDERSSVCEFNIV